MTQMNLVQAINSGLRNAMQQDDDVLILGEDVGRLGGVFRVTQGLQAEFGADRVLDTPLSETGILGTAIGMALYGLRPVSEIQFADFIYPGFDQLVNEAAKYRYRTAEYGPELVRLMLLRNDEASRLGESPLPDGTVLTRDGMIFELPADGEVVVRIDP